MKILIRKTNKDVWTAIENDWNHLRRKGEDGLNKHLLWFQQKSVDYVESAKTIWGMLEKNPSCLGAVQQNKTFKIERDSLTWCLKQNKTFKTKQNIWHWCWSSFDSRRKFACVFSKKAVELLVTKTYMRQYKQWKHNIPISVRK